MKPITVVIIYVTFWVILFLVGMNKVYGETLGLQRDKALHIGASFTAQVLCAGVVDEITDNKRLANVSCFIVVNGLGIAVEHGMLGDNTKDIKDVGANALGSGLGALTVEWKF